MSRPVRRPLTIGIATALALATPLLLSGCSLIPHPGGGGGISVPGVSVGTGKLPKDWPTDVPVATGDVITGASLGGDAAKGKVWNATIKVSGATAADDIRMQLTDAGFAGTDIGSTDKGSTASYTKDKYVVLVVVTKDDKNGWVANYTVTYDPKSDASNG
jgi:hypothetical protein